LGDSANAARWARFQLHKVTRFEWFARHSSPNLPCEEYSPVKKPFLAGAEMSADDGMHLIDGCRIYTK
jgi:hypothetical protein